jgi:hypothetical protein
MMIAPASAGDVSAAAALDRPPRAPAGDDSSTEDPAPDASPDVVVTLSRGSAAPATYDASGRMAATPTLDDLGANAPDSLAHASESVRVSPAPDDAPDDAPPADVDQDAAVAA